MISIIYVYYNNSDVIFDSINSVLNSKTKIDYEIIVVINKCTDIKIEELQKISSKISIIENETKVLNILKDEQVIKTLYTPKINLLVDKNLKNEIKYSKLPNKSVRSYLMNSSYTKEDRIINFENKNIWNFFKFIFKKLYE